MVILILIFLYENVPCTDPARIPQDGEHINWSIVRNKTNVNKETYKILKAVDDNINIDINDKTEDVENAVKSENVEETLEELTLKRTQVVPKLTFLFL